MSQGRDDDDLHGFDRRAFMRGAGVTAAGAALIHAHDSQAAAATRVVGPGALRISLLVNGAPRDVLVEPRTTLADALRTELGLTGTKVVCDRGACSACTVTLDGAPVCSCMTLAIDAVDRRIV